jgi:hypothetical protein
MSWLEDHLDNFVEPNTPPEEEAFIPFFDIPMSNNSQPFFTQEELTVIKNTWRSVKKASKDKTILLAGRDVFIFEILAQREGYPTKFMPECSRQTVRNIKIENLEDYFLFDTGFVGSIPKNLGMNNFTLMSYSNRENVSVQVSPRLTFSRGLALKIEKTPKYWESARVSTTGEILQGFSRHNEFINAARLTIEVYKNSSPKFISKHQPVGNVGRW